MGNRVGESKRNEADQGVAQEILRKHEDLEHLLTASESGVPGTMTVNHMVIEGDSGDTDGVEVNTKITEQTCGDTLMWTICSAC